MTADPRPERHTTVWRWLGPLLLFFVAKQLLLVFFFAPFTGHDEVDHFDYVRRLAAGDGLGVVGEVSLNPDLAPWQDYVADFPHNAEVIQPPLYHLLMVPLAWVSPWEAADEVVLIRLASALFGTGVIALTVAIALRFWPARPDIAAGAAVFIALQPQFGFEAAIVNHDMLLIFWVTLAVLLMLPTPDGLPRTDRRTLVVAVVVGAGIWTKTSALFALPVLALGVLWGLFNQVDSRNRVLRHLVILVGVAVALATPWFLRSLWLYGDPTGVTRLSRVSDYGDSASTLPAMIQSVPFWRGRFEDFWGNFGWRLIPLEPATYRVIALLWAVCGVGLAVVVYRSLRSQRAAGAAGWGMLSTYLPAIVLLAWIASFVAAMLAVGTVQFTQARFLFPAMPAIAILSAVGASGLVPTNWRRGVPAVLAMVMVAINLWIFLQAVVPFYTGSGGPTVLTR